MHFYKLNQAAKLLNYDVLDLLKAGAEGDIRLQVWCKIPVERIVVIEEDRTQEIGYFERQVYDKVYQEDDAYAHLIKNRFYELSTSILLDLYMGGNPQYTIPISSFRVVDHEEENLRISLREPIYLNTDRICIYEKDFRIAQKLDFSIRSKKTVPQVSPYAFTNTDVTDWGAVAIRFTDERKVEITFGQDIKSKCYDYESLGFGKKTRNGVQPNREWLTLFLMAESDGNPKDPKLWTDLRPRETANNKQVNALKMELLKLFPNVDGDPWEDYRAGIGWSLNLVLNIHLMTSRMNFPVT